LNVKFKSVARAAPFRGKMRGIMNIKGLNENHIRTITVTLYLIEKDIDAIERYIKDAPQGRMYEIIDDLNEEQKKKILKTIDLGVKIV
jgi:hypothetical protein